MENRCRLFAMFENTLSERYHSGICEDDILIEFTADNSWRIGFALFTGEVTHLWAECRRKKLSYILSAYRWSGRAALE